MTSEQARARLRWTILSLVFPVTFGHSTASRSPDQTFSVAIHFDVETSRPLFRCLAPFPWAAVVRWLALIPKALRSFRKHPIQYCSCPPTQPAPPTNFPNIMHFGSLVSSMRATYPTNKIRLLRKVASMFSLPVLISVSRWEIGWSVR